MEPDGLQQLVDSLADRIQRSVAIDDPGIHLIVASKHFGDEDAVRVQSLLGRDADRRIAERVLALGIERAHSPQHIAAIPEIDLTKPRLCFPIRYGGLLLGFLWLIEDENLKPRHVHDTEAAAEAAGMLLYRRYIALEQRQIRQETMLRDLLAADLVSRQRAEDEMYEAGLVDDRTRVTVMVGYVPRAARIGDIHVEHEKLETAIAQANRRVRQMHTERSVLAFAARSRLVLLFIGRTAWTDTAMKAVASSTIDLVSNEIGTRVVAGIGATSATPGDAYRSHEQAVVAGRAAEFLPGLGDIVFWETLGVYGLLANLAPRELSATGYPAALTKLAGARNGHALLHTAETFLDCAGDVQRAADELHIHRTTLYQRIDRIEKLSGLSFSEGLDRLTLHLGIKLARLAGSREIFPP